MRRRTATSRRSPLLFSQSRVHFTGAPDCGAEGSWKKEQVLQVVKTPQRRQVAVTVGATLTRSGTFRFVDENWHVVVFCRSLTTVYDWSVRLSRQATHL